MRGGDGKWVLCRDFTPVRRWGPVLLGGRTGRGCGDIPAVVKVVAAAPAFRVPAARTVRAPTGVAGHLWVGRTRAAVVVLVVGGVAVAGPEPGVHRSDDSHRPNPLGRENHEYVPKHGAAEVDSPLIQHCTWYTKEQPTAVNRERS